jgi:hypothetical protein
MRIRIGVALASVLALALAAVAFAAPSPFKVTGGGQILASADSSGVKGPGDTISFQAFMDNEGLDNTASGHVNVIDRTAGATTKKGKGIHYRGTVNCTFLATDPALGGGYVELYGNATTKTGSTVPFLIRIQDNGQGAAADTDMIEFDTTGNETCGENDDEETPAAYLARGNAKIHKQNPSTTSSSSSSSSSSATSLSLNLLGLR